MRLRDILADVPSSGQRLFRLEENAIDIGDRGRTLAFRNPVAGQFHKLLRKLGMLRGLLDQEGSNYVWDGLSLHHDEAAARLGVTPAATYVASMGTDGRMVVNRRVARDLLAFPEFVRMLGDLEVRVA